VALAACGSGDAGDGTAAGDTTPGGTATTSAPVTLPLAEHFLDEPDVTTVATDLAPSQTAASTVPDPLAPDRCGADAVEMWTAQVTADGSTAVIRMRNVGETWCDIDIGRSPRIDPAIEPDVWLQPGETADLVVGPNTSECADPEVVDRVQVAVLDESMLVPTVLVTCGWWLTALYPNDVATEPCDLADLEVAVTAAVVVRNASATPCRMGGLEAVDGAEVVARSEGPTEITQLHPGDVASFGRLAGDPCQGANTVVLTDELVGRLEVPGVFCTIVFELGPAAPWFGTRFGPGPGDTGDASAESVIDALDPFREGE
jgi:hypothetical protein